MTLDGVVAVILRYFTEFGILGANYVKLDEDMCIMFSVYGKSVAQRIYFLAIYDLRRYSQSIMRISALTRGTPL